MNLGTHFDAFAAAVRAKRYSKPVMGLKEFAAVLGVSPNCLSNWRARDAVALPKPTDLAAGPIWSADNVRTWLESIR